MSSVNDHVNAIYAELNNLSDSELLKLHASLRCMNDVINATLNMHRHAVIHHHSTPLSDD